MASIDKSGLDSNPWGALARLAAELNRARNGRPRCDLDLILNTLSAARAALDVHPASDAEAAARAFLVALEAVAMQAWVTLQCAARTTSELADDLANLAGPPGDASRGSD